MCSVLELETKAAKGQSIHVTACWGQKDSRETTENDGDMVDWRDPPPSNQLQLAVLYLYDFFLETAAVINYGANATYKQINKKIKEQ